MNWGDFISRAKASLKQEYDPEECSAVLNRLLEGRAGVRRVDQVLRRAEPVPPETLQQLESDLARLCAGEPVQYILGRAPFLGMLLRVAPAVLIPRQETEELVNFAVERILQWRSTHPDREVRLLDIGTGSGCIAIALRRSFPEAFVQALDVSEDALLLATENAREQQTPVRFRQWDVLDHPELPDAPYACIVSNPPYIPCDREKQLLRRVREQEPALALFSPSEDPLVFYRVIAERASIALECGGWLLLEIHAGTGASVAELLRKAGLVAVEVRLDFSGHERIVIGQRPEQAEGSLK
jgi:release factor glutamine methyltransferase